MKKRNKTKQNSKLRRNQTREHHEHRAPEWNSNGVKKTRTYQLGGFERKIVVSPCSLENARLLKFSSLKKIDLPKYPFRNCSMEPPFPEKNEWIKNCLKCRRLVKGLRTCAGTEGRRGCVLVSRPGKSKTTISLVYIYPSQRQDLATTWCPPWCQSMQHMCWRLGRRFCLHWRW